MQDSLADLIQKNEEKLVDRAATSIKVMFGVAYADMAQEDLENQLFNFFDALAEISRQGVVAPDLIQEIAGSVLVTPISQGWNYRAITEEILRVIDFSISKQIDLDFSQPDQLDRKTAARDLLAAVIRAAKDAVNGRARQDMAKKFQAQVQEEPGAEKELAEASLMNEAGIK